MAVEVSIEVEGVEDDALEADAQRVLEALGYGESEVSVVLADDPFVQDLNARWREKDVPTDVLSFPQEEEPEDGDLLGDVVISVDTARRQATDAGHELATELRVLLVHGICHLIGHDHLEDEDREAMQAAERQALASLGLDRDGLIHRAHAAD